MICYGPPTRSASVQPCFKSIFVCIRLIQTIFQKRHTQPQNHFLAENAVKCKQNAAKTMIFKVHFNEWGVICFKSYEFEK